MKLALKITDIIIIILVTGITLFFAYSVYMKKSEMYQVIIRGQGSEWNFPINAKETIIVQGVLGNTIVRIDGEKSWVESSPCINQTCVATGKISKQGQWAACLPNNVLVILMGPPYVRDKKIRENKLEEEDLDAVAF